jgi:predicted CXXCH cytochrome family protein
LPEDYFKKVILLPLQYGHGHPVERHPVIDIVDPSNMNHVLKPINCLTCHQSHSGANQGMLVKDQANDMAFCMTCHANMTQGKGPQAQGAQPQVTQPQGGKTK